MIDELGIEPGHALQDLEAAILRHDAALDPREATARRDGRNPQR